MAYTQIKGPKLNVPFAHEYDPATGVQVPVVKVLGSVDGGAGAAAADREFLTVDYQVTTAFTGAAVGDFVRSVEVWDIGATSATQVGTTTWRNISKGTVLASTPNVNNISVAGASTAGLTNAQLRASPLPLMDGAATSVLQQAISDAIATMSGKVATQSGLASIFDQIGATNTGIGALNTKLATEVTLSSVATLLTAIRDRTPTLGVKDAAGSSSVTFASNDAAIGSAVTAAGAPGTGGSGLLGWLSAIASRVLGVGDPADAVAATDTGSASLVSLTKRLLAKLPPSIGGKVSATSVSVVLASDDAQIGTKVTAVAALGTGGTGLIGWLSQLWQASINMALQLPATLGIKTSALSLSVTPSSDSNLALERYTAAPIWNLNTPVTASTYTALPSQICNNVMLVNPSTVDLEFQIAGTGGRMAVLAGTGYQVPGITNANQIGVRRRDAASAAQVAVEFCAQALVQ